MITLSQDALAVFAAECRQFSLILGGWASGQTGPVAEEAARVAVKSLLESANEVSAGKDPATLRACATVLLKHMLAVMEAAGRCGASSFQELLALGQQAREAEETQADHAAVSKWLAADQQRLAELELRGAAVMPERLAFFRALVEEHTAHLALLEAQGTLGQAVSPSNTRMSVVRWLAQERAHLAEMERRGLGTAEELAYVRAMVAEHTAHMALLDAQAEAESAAAAAPPG